MDNKELADKLVEWIREKVTSAGSRGVVLGMSGGVDSAVLAVLCRRAFPGNMLGVIMPCYSCAEDEAHARDVATRFSIPTETVVIDPIYDAFFRALPKIDTRPDVKQVAEANLKARLRMCTLYYFANELGYLVAGSGNRSELAVGYFTKYGDGGVDILPLGRLVKSHVRELARFLDIPQPIIDKPPSAGLWEGQTDEDELGFGYAELDRFLLTGDASSALKNKIESRKAANRHKTLVPPVPDFQA
jgi:NAD+ synthase